MAKITWTKEEDQIIVDGVELFLKTGKSLNAAYKQISNSLPGKNIKSISNRWQNHLKKLHPEIVAPNSNWSDVDDAYVRDQIIKGLKKGESVTSIVKSLKKKYPNKSEKSLENRWYYAIRPNCLEEYHAAVKEGRSIKKALKAGEKFVEKNPAIYNQPEKEESSDQKEKVESYGNQANVVVGQKMPKGFMETLKNHINTGQHIKVNPALDEMPKESFDLGAEKKVDEVDKMELQHLTDFVTNVTNLVEERNELKSENNSLRSQNRHLHERNRELEEELEARDRQYREVMQLITKVQSVITDEQSATSEDELKGLKLTINRMGTLVNVQ